MGSYELYYLRRHKCITYFNLYASSLGFLLFQYYNLALLFNFRKFTQNIERSLNVCYPQSTGEEILKCLASYLSTTRLLFFYDCVRHSQNEAGSLTVQFLVSARKSYMLKQTCSFQLHVPLSFLVGTSHQRVNQNNCNIVM